jgi:ubiquinone/menaquinone biosynthesis C-methylase UbiE
MNASAVTPCAAGAAFDGIAEKYDAMFTESLVGRAQRSAVWGVLEHTFVAGHRVLELNCGTGEDALHLSRRGISVVACDASSRMIEVARRKFAAEPPASSVSFHVLSTEHISEIAFRAPFDGVFSNFAGLNCVDNLADVADQLATIVRPGASVVLCLCARFCLWEALIHLARGEWRKAIRRWAGHAEATLNGVAVRVQYPAIRDLRRTLSPWFHLRSIRAVGLAVPPSYMEPWAREHPQWLRAMVRVDALMSAWPMFRGCGDHVLLVFERRAR